MKNKYFYAKNQQKKYDIQKIGYYPKKRKGEIMMLFKTWLKEWLELYVKPLTKERTYSKYLRQTEMYLLPALGEYDIDELSALRLQKFATSLSDRGLAASTVNGVMFVMRSSLKKAVALGIAHSQYTDAIISPKARVKQVVCFNKAEQKKIESYVLTHKTPYLFGILLSMYTGLRIGELLALTWEDIDLKNGVARVSKSCYDSWEGGHYLKVMDTTKTQCSERVIPLPKQIVVQLKQLKKQTHSRYVVAAKSEYGAQIRVYQRTFERILKKLNIARKGFHALRHTFATRALEVGMDVKTLSEIMGHRDPTITLKRYAHSFMEHKAQMMNKLGRFLDETVETKSG